MVFIQHWHTKLQLWSKRLFAEQLCRIATKHTVQVIPQRLLLAFDFDHTIIDADSDIHIHHLIRNGQIPDNIQALYSNGWTDYMATIFEILHKQKITPNQILGYLEEIPLVAGMKDLLTAGSAGHLVGSIDNIIISDSNSVFIQTILKHLDLLPNITEVFTNPAYFDENGLLKISYHHTQDWCDLSTKNLCKGHVLTTFIKNQLDKGITYDYIMYVGDGTNDLCPSLKLEEKDYIFAREDYSLCKAIAKYQVANPGLFKAQVVKWRSGLDILAVMEMVLGGNSTTVKE